jgi:ferredoxin-thioredoxin reductase catalytic subunit
MRQLCELYLLYHNHIEVALRTTDKIGLFFRIATSNNTTEGKYMCQTMYAKFDQVAEGRCYCHSA